jgi:thiamine kinase-like enzyme
LAAVDELSMIVDRLQVTLGPAGGTPTPLSGGITNRNFRVRFGQRECVLRLPGRDTELLGIDRGAERLASAQAAELGIAPPLVAAGDGYLVTEYLDAEPIDGDRLRAAPESATLALRAFHDSGLQLPTRFWVPELLDDYARIVQERGNSLPPEYEQARALAARVAAVLPLDDPVPCHDDLLPSNVLSTRADPDRAVLVDWEYAGMGHRMFDLGNLAVNNEFDEATQDRALQAYCGEPPTAGQRAALALMRIMSDAREAAWGVVQGSISDLDFDFAEYAEQHFQRLNRSARDPRLEEWLRAATA